MQKFYAFIGILMLACAYQSAAQAPSIAINNSEFSWSTCLNKVYQLPVSVSGNFNGDNRFSVQVRKGEFSSVTTEIPVVLNAGKIEFSFTDSVTHANSTFQVKVISSSPRVESQWSNPVAVHSKGIINLNSAAVSDTLNAYESARIQLSGLSFSSVRVTLNDSSRFEIYPNELNFSSVQTLTVSQTSTFRIAHAENVCGAMKTSGSYNSVINSTSIKTIAVMPQSVCENGEVKLNFSTSGSTLNAQTKFRIRFSEVNPAGAKPLSVEVPAEVNGNVLTARFPSTFKVQTLKEFYAQVITSNPAAVGAHSNVRLWVWAAPTAVFNTSSQTVNMNDYLSLDVRVTGLSPFTVELTDGSVVSSANSVLNFYPHPFQNTSYSIKSFSSGCGKIETANPQVVEIKVRPGIRIADGEKPLTICAGSKAKLPFTSNATLTDATRFSIRIVNGMTGEITQLAATRSGENLEFEMPYKAVFYQGHSYQIITINPAMESQQSSWIVTQTIPDVRFDGYNFGYSYTVPSNVKVNYILTGGAPYKIEYMDGTTAEYADGNILSQSFFLKQTTDFKIKSISNSCFKNETVQSARITLIPTEAPGIYLETINKAVCGNDSIEFVFGTVGKFNPGNVFTIQGYSNCCEIQTFGTVQQGGKYKIKMSTQSYYYQNSMIRIASSNPVLFSEAAIFSIQSKPEQFYLYPQGRADNPIRYLATDQGVGISVQASKGTLASVVYAENGVEKTYTNSDPYSTIIPIKPEIGKYTAYEIKSGTNQCGTVPINLVTYIQIMPYRIQLSQPTYELKYCAGSPIIIPFGITDGVANGASYSLQIAKTGGSEFVTLVSGEKGRILSGVIPADVSPGIYDLRIISSDGALSDNTQIQIGAVPSASLTTENQQNAVTIDAGQSVSLRVNLKGSAPWTVIFDDNSVQNFYNEQETRSFYTTKKQQFGIKSVSNVCGYGTGTGSVLVTVRPGLTASSDAYNVCQGGTFKVLYNLLGDVDMSDEYLRFELHDLTSGSVIALDSTKIISGEKILKLPQVLTGSNYQVRCVIKKYNLVSVLSASITTKPSVTLSGSSVINLGENTQLILKSNQNNSSSKFTLSDGTTGNIYGRAGNVEYVSVSPKQTTTYTLTSLSNSCGQGVMTGSATIEVNPASERTVRVTSVSAGSGIGICTGDSIVVYYSGKGTFTASNKMTVQISDTTGRNFRSLPTVGNGTTLKAIVPLDLLIGKLYRIRVVASDPNTASGAYEFPLMAGRKARAKFASESVIYDGKKNPKIVVLLEGGAPWSYQFGTDLLIQNRTTYNAIDSIQLLQASPSQFYKIFNVWNSCGQGTVDSPSTVRVEVVTGTEPSALPLDVVVFPNPAQDMLTIKFNGSGKRNIRLLNILGIALYELSSRNETENIDIRTLPSGIYILHIASGNKTITYKIAKQ